MTVVTESELKRLDELLRLLTEGSRWEESRIALEHVEAARLALMGAMPDEYRMNLRLARDVIAAIPDEHFRARADQLLGGLLTPG